MTCFGSVAAIVASTRSFTALPIYIKPGKPDRLVRCILGGVGEGIIVQAPGRASDMAILADVGASVLSRSRQSFAGWVDDVELLSVQALGCQLHYMERWSKSFCRC